MKIFSVNGNHVIPYKNLEELRDLLQHDNIKPFSGFHKWIKMRFSVSKSFYRISSLIFFSMLYLACAYAGSIYLSSYDPLLGGSAVVLFFLALNIFKVPLFFLRFVPALLATLFPGSAPLMVLGIIIFNITTIRSMSRNIDKMKSLIYLYEQGEITKDYFVMTIGGTTSVENKLDKNPNI